MSYNFNYQPLDLRKRQIRLLRCVRSQHGGVRLKISNHYLESRSCPRYWALSYTWGTESPLFTVYVDNKRFVVRRNLHTLLCAIRYGAPLNLDHRTKTDFCLDEMYFWVDQICIDQDSNVERNHQVEMMELIYERAVSTVIWLGPKSDIPGCNELLHYVMRNQDSLPARIEFFEQAYWERLWVVQEIMLSSTLLIMCGLHGIFWEDFATYYISTAGEPALKDPEGLAYKSHIWALVERKRDLASGISHLMGKQSLRQTIETFGDRYCRDPRDKIFGLQSLVSEWQRIPVDYRLTVAELYFFVLDRVMMDGHFEGRVIINGFAEKLKYLLDLEDDHIVNALWRLAGPLMKRRVELYKRGQMGKAERLEPLITDIMDEDKLYPWRRGRLHISRGLLHDDAVPGPMPWP